MVGEGGTADGEGWKEEKTPAFSLGGTITSDQWDLLWRGHKKVEFLTSLWIFGTEIAALSGAVPGQGDSLECHSTATSVLLLQLLWERNEHQNHPMAPP